MLHSPSSRILLCLPLGGQIKIIQARWQDQLKAFFREESKTLLWVSALRFSEPVGEREPQHEAGQAWELDGSWWPRKCFVHDFLFNICVRLVFSHWTTQLLSAIFESWLLWVCGLHFAEFKWQWAEGQYCNYIHLHTNVRISMHEHKV